MLGAKEIKLVIPLLLLHELGEELPPVPGHELRRELHHVQVEGRDGWRVRDELELGRGLLWNHGLLDHLGLHLQGEGHRLSDFLQGTPTKCSGESFFFLQLLQESNAICHPGRCKNATPTGII